MSREEKKGNKEKPCNHFMVWNIQGGYSYYRCDNCNYIDGKKTFEAQKQELREKIEGMKKDSPTIEQIEDATEDIKQFLLKALTQQKQELREKIDENLWEWNWGRTGNEQEIIKGIKEDINQLLK